MYQDFMLRFADPAEADSVLFEGEGDDRRITYYPRRLSNAELQAITT